ncbi:vWA domain-containing protein [Caldicellulosiruptor changbaiensis]|uniref:vWA domain-containing protein n=1 Tax=Caldicellulosiruptor changbaiensis TaxID=1222016 RepID=UPI0019D0A6F4|nr:VWA domain-containing protein [Caldicellulosiruptor changbaiensis]
MDEKRIEGSKVLPFRFFAAHRELENSHLRTNNLYAVLGEVLKKSIKNIPKLVGKTFIAADVSASMAWTRLSRESSFSVADIAVLFLAMANYICEDTITVTFDTELKKVVLDPNGNIIANAKNIPITGGGTDINLPIKYLLKNNIFVDRIIIFSDNQINVDFDYVCQKLVDRYRKMINPNVWVHAVDLEGYGTQQFKGDKVNIIAGWSEKVLEFIPLAEHGVTTLVDRIKKYEI